MYVPLWVLVVGTVRNLTRRLAGPADPLHAMAEKRPWKKAVADELGGLGRASGGMTRGGAAISLFENTVMGLPGLLN